MADNDDQLKMTKAEIIEHIYEKSGISRKDIHGVIDSFFDEVKDALNEDRVVELRGFGTFEIRTRKGREKARNPKNRRDCSGENPWRHCFPSRKRVEKDGLESQALIFN